MGRILRSATPIPIILLEEMWIAEDKEGHYSLVPMNSIFMKDTSLEFVKKIPLGAHIAIILP